MSNIQQARDIYDAVNRGDIVSALRTFDSGIEWREAEGNPYEPTGSPWTGPDAVTQNLFVKVGADWDGKLTCFQQFMDTAQLQEVMGAR